MVEMEVDLFRDLAVQWDVSSPSVVVVAVAVEAAVIIKRRVDD